MHTPCNILFRPLRDDEKLPVRTHRVVSGSALAEDSGEVVKEKKKHRKDKESKKEKKKKRGDKKEEKVNNTLQSL